MFWFVVIGSALIILFAFELLVRFLRRKRSFSGKVRAQIERHLEKIASLPAKDQILEYDKLLDFCLGQKNYKGSLGEKMKQYGPNFQNTNAIWKAHKLRNTLAHELDSIPSVIELQEAVRSFRQEIAYFLNIDR